MVCTMVNRVCKICGKRTQVVPAEAKKMCTHCGCESFEEHAVEVELDPRHLAATFRQTCRGCGKVRVVPCSDRAESCNACGDLEFDEKIIE